MSDDLIKRSDAIEAYSDIYWIDDRLNLAFREELDKIDEKIRNIPIVEVADRPQGEWIRDRYWSRGVGMGEEYGFFYKCSLCEYEVENGYTRCGFNFCPNCGARMKGANDDN